MAVKMAATFYCAPKLCKIIVLYLILLVTTIQRIPSNGSGDVLSYMGRSLYPISCLQGRKLMSQANAPRRPITIWTKHGFICLFLPARDLTICMDIAPNPGPTLTDDGMQETCLSQVSRSNHISKSLPSSSPSSRSVYSSSELYMLHRFSNLNSLCQGYMMTNRTPRSNILGDSRFFKDGLMQQQQSIPTVFTFNRCKPRMNNLRSRNINNLSYIKTSRQNGNSPKVCFAVWNAQSINKKVAIVCDIIQSNKLEILAITESWLPKDINNNNSTVTEILNILKEFAFLHIPRETGKGGGVALFYRKHLKITINSTVVFKSFEHMDLSVVYGNFNARLIVIYRPPPSKKNKLTTSMFYTDFSKLIETLTNSKQPLLISGDFNFHLDNTANPDTMKFMDLLDSADLVQNVFGTTHRKGHTLDLIITQRDDKLISDVGILPDIYSDHRVVTCKLNCPKPPVSKVLVSYRSTKQLNSDDLTNTISESFSHDHTTIADANGLIDTYNGTLKSIYDDIAPIQTRLVNHRPWAPWYNDALREAKRAKRRMERKYRKSHLTVDKQLFTESCERYNRMLEKYKIDYYKDKIKQADNNKLFRLVENLFQKNNKVLPSHTSQKVLAVEFNNFFTNKIRHIRNELEVQKAQTTKAVALQESNGLASEFKEFHLPGNKVIQDIITSMPAKTCSLDPIPTHVVKNHLELLTPVIGNIIRSSLSVGLFPNQLKISHVGPRLKKYDLDREQFPSFRPVANIAFLSKVLEKIVTHQAHGYLNTNNLFPSLQSAYRQFHSTETALLKVTNDILRSLDSNQDVILVMLDLSAAFDTLDHDILVRRLETYFGFSAKVLQWFKSYFTGRAQSVVIGDSVSSPRPLEFGVPQGSILGPLLFSLYMAPLQNVISKHDLNCMLYADDTQLYIAVNPKNLCTAEEMLRRCIADVILWNTDNMLLCNPGKTEVIHFTSRYNKNHNLLSEFSLDSTSINVSDKVLNLGIILDKNLTMSAQINRTCQKARMAIKAIGRMRKYLSLNDLKRLVNALVISRLDYANSTLYGVPKYQLEKLQRVQNAAGRLITGIKKFEHITSALMGLHWLPIEYRIKFKILLLVYKSLNGLAPDYLSGLIKEYRPVRALRSSHRSLLHIPKVNGVTYGQRAFSYAAPELWNLIPDIIKSSESIIKFKSALKTYYFKAAYNC